MITNNTRRKSSLLGAVALLSALFLLCLSLISCTKSKDTPSEDTLLSPAISILADRATIAKAALVGESIKFSSEDFARALNLESVESITLTELPPLTDGELRVGSSVITGKQTLSASGVSLMTYHSSSEDISCSSFKFKVNNQPYELTCKLYSLDEQNYAPTLSLSPQTSLEVSTYEDVTCFGRLSCYDPDGDATSIEIVSYPKKGILVIDDGALGTYRYIPYENATGNDSFVYVARDCYGNYSPSKEVSIEIKRSEMSEKYVDLDASPHRNAALAMTEKRIMSGTQVGNSLYFYPDREVSRAEFTVMAMTAAGVRELSDRASTVFSDDAEIPESMKPYIATAYQLGYIKGTPDGNGGVCFEPSRSITRAEAAVMLGNMLGAATPTVEMTVADGEEIPAWAESSVYAMLELGVLELTEDGASPGQVLTRGSAADVLLNFIRCAD